VLAEVVTTGRRPSLSKRGAKTVPSSLAVSLSGAGKRASLLTATSSSGASAAAALGREHHEARLLGGVFLEDAGELRGDRRDVGLLHAADRHALMHGLDHHRHALGLEC